MRMGKILVVDDEPSVRDVYVQYLSMAGYEVDTSASGEEAMQVAAHRSYDLLILDLRMNGMNGLATLDRLRVMTPDAKAVVVSGSVDEFASELADARKKGLMGVLPKPFALQDLRALVDRALHGRIQAA